MIIINTCRNIFLLISVSIIFLQSQAQPKLVGMMQHGCFNNGVIVEYIGGDHSVRQIDSINFVGGCVVPHNMTMTEGANGKMYGIFDGTLNCNSGGIISRNIADSTALYSIEQEFTAYGTTPVNPLSSLLLATDGWMYGQDYAGGSNLRGCFYSYDAMENTVYDILDNNFYCLSSTLQFPSVLIQSKDSGLYGVNIEHVICGGSYYASGIFRYDLQSGQRNYLRIDSTTLDSLPGVLLETSVDTFYGLSSAFICRFIPGTPGVYTKLYHLPQNANPNGTLTLASNGQLYGLTSGDGTYGKGTIFSYNVYTGAYNSLYSFGATAYDGLNPTGDLMQASDGNLYGVTAAGGDSSLGVIFQYNISSSTYTKEVSLDSTAYAVFEYGHLVEHMPVSHHIDLQPIDAGLCSNGMVTFTAHDSSTFPASIQWQVSTDQGISYSNIAAANYNTYSFYASSNLIGNKYRAVFSSGDTSLSATLFADSVQASFTIQPTNTPHLWNITNQCSGPAPLTYIWSWGDGTSTTTGDTASHTYSAAGYYNVCVNVTGGQGCSASYCDSNVYLYKDQSGQMVQINVLPRVLTGISSFNDNRFRLSPNPASGSFRINHDYYGELYIKLFDLLGKTLREYRITEQDATFDISGIASGMYEVQLGSSDKQILKVFRLVKE